MKPRGTSDRRTLPKLAALTLLVASAAVLSFSFAAGMSDSVQWRRISERAVVDPSFEAKRAPTTKRITEFTLKDRRGNDISLSDFASVDLLVVNLWSTGCPGCERELPSLMEMDRRFGALGNVALLTITIDESWDDVQHLFPTGTDLRILFDPEAKVVKDLFGTTLFPETFILDRQRRVAARFDGERQWHTREMLAYIASYLPR